MHCNLRLRNVVLNINCEVLIHQLTSSIFYTRYTSANNQHLPLFWPNLYWHIHSTVTAMNHNPNITIRFSDPNFQRKAIILLSDNVFRCLHGTARSTVCHISISGLCDPMTLNMCYKLSTTQVAQIRVGSKIKAKLQTKIREGG